MLLGILSDTHDELLRTRRAVAMLRGAGAEALVDCGDLASGVIVPRATGLASAFLGEADKRGTEKILCLNRSRWLFAVTSRRRL